MRSEKEMLDMIMRTAAEDPRIRAAYLEGSRVNPKVPRDMFQDFDVQYIVTDTASFREDKAWIDRFGERLYMQYPEDGVYAPSDVMSSYGWLMQFADGNRLDLHVSTREHALANLELYRTLIDKDGIMPQAQEISDERYWVRKPTYEQFQCTCNEFWWCLNNVAKGLWRKELPYVMDMVDCYVRPMLRRMLEWQIGTEHQFMVSVGKAAKYMKDYLPADRYNRYLLTYAGAEVEAVWNAVEIMCGLFDETAREVGGKLGFSYDVVEADNSRGYLEHVRNLPADAAVIF